jgi:hypothetical protein
MKFKNLSFPILYLLVFILLVVLPLRGGVTGKIGGLITDKISGEALAGVNIVVEGMQLGSSTDEDGSYFILQLPPGKYNLVVSYLGYSDVRVENVTVMVDHTTQVSVKLQEKVLELEDAIVIVAERPVIQKDLTSSTQFVSAEELRQMPVRDVEEVVFLQTGVLSDGLPLLGGLGGGGKGEPRYSIRGGSQDEVIWYVDGIRTASSIESRADRGGSFTSLNINAIEEIQVITGGFNAEYGNAQSGIVNVITKDGGNKIDGSVELLYGLTGQRHFGTNLYDRNIQKEFIDNTNPDGSLDPNWWTDYRMKQIYDYTNIPDQTIFINLGGPLFTQPNYSGTFFISSQLKKEAYTFPRPRDTRDLENLLINSAFRLRSSTKLRLSVLYNHEAHTTLQENADFINQAKYYRGWGSLLDTYTYSASAQWDHTLAKDIFYDLKLSWSLFEFRERPSTFTELGESANPTLFGFDRYDGYPDEPFDAYAFLYDNHSKNSDISLVGSFNWQFDESNLFKSGFEFRYHTLDEISTTRYPSFSNHPDDWINRGLHEKFNPFQIALYLQDKMEFESMILNVGVRYDYFNPNRDWFTNTGLYNIAVDPDFDPTINPEIIPVDSMGRVKYSFNNVLDKPREPAASFHMISPRLGVSFPVTENTLLHFNYGHFYQMPPLDRMFEFNYFRPEYIAKAYYNARINGNPIEYYPSKRGDPERVVVLTLEPLKPEKTVMFEVGLKHNFNNFAKLAVTAFYKDVFDQNEPRFNLFDRRIYGYDPFNDPITANIFYVSNFPGDYGDSRGFEIAFRTLFSRIFTFDVNYSFSIATEGRASPARIDLDENGNATYTYDTDVELRIPTEKSFSRPHVLRANLFLSYPYYNGTSILSKIMKGTSASILYKLVSGQAFTYLRPEDPPDTYNNYRYPSIKIVDLKLDKMFDLWASHSLMIYLRITNLLNTKNLRSYGDIFFDENATKNYVEEGTISTVDGAGYDISYQTWYETRRYYFGIKYNF